MSVQITKNSTEFESGGFVFQFSECSLALLFFKKKHRKDPKKIHINIIYTIQKKKRRKKKKKKKLAEKIFPLGLELEVTAERTKLCIKGSMSCNKNSSSFGSHQKHP